MSILTYLPDYELNKQAVLSRLKNSIADFFPYQVLGVPYRILIGVCALFCVSVVILCIVLCTKRKLSKSSINSTKCVKPSDFSSNENPTLSKQSSDSVTSKRNKKGNRGHNSYLNESVNVFNVHPQEKQPICHYAEAQKACYVEGNNVTSLKTNKNVGRKVSKNLDSQSTSKATGNSSFCKKIVPIRMECDSKQHSSHTKTAKCRNNCLYQAAAKRSSLRKACRLQSTEGILTSNPVHQRKAKNLSTQQAEASTACIVINRLSSCVDHFIEPRKLKSIKHNKSIRRTKKNSNKQAFDELYGELPVGYLIKIDNLGHYVIHSEPPQVVYVKDGIKCCRPDGRNKIYRSIRKKLKCPYLGELKHVIAEQKRTGNLKAALKAVPQQHKKHISTSKNSNKSGKISENALNVNSRSQSAPSLFSIQVHQFDHDAPMKEQKSVSAISFELSNEKDNTSSYQNNYCKVPNHLERNYRSTRRVENKSNKLQQASDIHIPQKANGDHKLFGEIDPTSNANCEQEPSTKFEKVREIPTHFKNKHLSTKITDCHYGKNHYSSCQESELLRMLEARRRGKSVKLQKNCHYNDGESASRLSNYKSENKSIPIEVVHLAKDVENSNSSLFENGMGQEALEVSQEYLHKPLQSNDDTLNLTKVHKSTHNQVYRELFKKCNEKRDVEGQENKEITFLRELQQAVAARQQKV